MSYEEKAKAKAHAPSKKTKFGELKEAEDADFVFVFCYFTGGWGLLDGLFSVVA